MTKEEQFVTKLREIKSLLDGSGVVYWLDWGTLLGAVRNGKMIEWDHDIDLGTMATNWKKLTPLFPEFEKRFSLKFEPQDYIFLDWAEASRDKIDFYRISIALYHVKGANVLSKVREPILVWQGLLLLCNLLAFGEAGFVRPKFELTVRILKQGLSLFPHKLRKLVSTGLQRVVPKRIYGKPNQITVVPKHYFEELKTIKFYDMTFYIPSNVNDYLALHYGKNWKIPKRTWDWKKEDGTVKETATNLHIYCSKKEI